MSVLGLSTSYCAAKGLSIYDSVLKITDLGFTTVEFGAAHVFEAGVWGTLKKIRKEFPDINCSIHTLFPPHENKVWFNPADGLTDLNRLVIDNLFASAEILHAMWVSIHPAIINEIRLEGKEISNFDKPLVGRLRDKGLCKEKFLELMDYVEAKSKKNDLRVLIENTIPTLVIPYPCSADEFSCVFNKFPHTGLLLDIGHALVSGQLQELMGLDDRIWQLHLHDRHLERGYIGHQAIKDIEYFVKIEKLLLKSIPVIFEHGADIADQEILKEKNLLEYFLEINEERVVQGVKNG